MSSGRRRRRRQTGAGGGAGGGGARINGNMWAHEFHAPLPKHTGNIRNE